MLNCMFVHCGAKRVHTQRSYVDPKRSALMSRVKGRNTKPELKVRQLVHALGYRFRLHQRILSGVPDLVLARHRKVIFVHGCFWHRHFGCPMSSTPKTRRSFWLSKFKANMARDARHEAELRHLGWKVCVIWECETRNEQNLLSLLRLFFGKRSKNSER
jgi:DNA mismatch endonuclease, patch repair protein